MTTIVPLTSRITGTFRRLPSKLNSLMSLCKPSEKIFLISSLPTIMTIGFDFANP
jgi:hypothetical protein